MATMALLRVAETAMKTKGDHSDDAVLYSERLHHALTDADDATAKTHAPAALLPLGILLMRTRVMLTLLLEMQGIRNIQLGLLPKLMRAVLAKKRVYIFHCVI